MNATDRLSEEWWRNVYLPTLSPEEREAEIASRGWAWRLIEPGMIAALQRLEDAELLGAVSDTDAKDGA